MRAFAKRAVSQERQRLLQMTLNDPMLSFNALNRDAELFAPGEILRLCRCAFGFICKKTADPLSIPRARLLLDLSWMLSRDLRRQLVEFIATKPSEAYDLMRNPPDGMRIKAQERARLIEAMRRCPSTSFKALRSGAGAEAGNLALKPTEVRLLALSAMNSSNRRRVIRFLRDKQPLPRRMLRKLAQAA